MKRVIIAAFVILAAVMLGLFFINDKAPEIDVTAQKTPVGVLLNGSRMDGSYCQTHYEALEAIKDELNLQILYRDNIVGDETCYDEIVDLIEQYGCRIIVAVSFQFGEYMTRAAETYPDVYFFHATGTNRLNNLSTYFGRMYQVRYLSGIVAGLRTETGHLGYVAAFPISEVIRGINAFAEGVRSVREDAVIHVKYSDSWTEDDLAGNAGTELFDKYPIDVMSLHTDSLRPIEEADKRGIWSVGYNLDQSERFPDTYLTACVWHWEVYYREQILKCLQDKFHGSHDWINMEEGIAGLSPLTENAAEGSREAVRKAEELLLSRTYDVFYGPIRDNEGNIRIEDGDSMPDDEMLNRFDWYVEGVLVEE
ncbi:MAG: BMP family ABC transporter substrate-binding protein [Lachnospiraceae bacterium]|nr:BMP family ABC transporter substrate-binding protein [Lachnospiraceae bacterium]